MVCHRHTCSGISTKMNKSSITVMLVIKELQVHETLPNFGLNKLAGKKQKTSDILHKLVKRKNIMYITSSALPFMARIQDLW